MIELKIELIGIKPPIWRRILVPNDISLDILHSVLQGAMPWQDYHLHEFEIGEDRFEARDERDDSWDPNDGRKDKRSLLLESWSRKAVSSHILMISAMVGGISSPLRRLANQPEDQIWTSPPVLPESERARQRIVAGPILTKNFSTR